MGLGPEFHRQVLLRLSRSLPPSAQFPSALHPEGKSENGWGRRRQRDTERDRWQREGEERAAQRERLAGTLGCGGFICQCLPSEEPLSTGNRMGWLFHHQKGLFGEKRGLRPACQRGGVDRRKQS